MKRIAFILAVLVLAVSAVPAVADRNVPLSTPTDLCAHEHIKLKYYFDTPVYHPLDEWTHSVTGRATVETYCEDCGTVLSVTIDNNAEEIRGHVFRKGRCALCGMEGEEPSESVEPSDAHASSTEPQEIVLILEPEGGDGNLYAASLTPVDLDYSGDILVLRAGICEPAVVLQPKKLREQMDDKDTLAVGMALTGEHAVGISVCVTAENGAESEPDSRLIALRFYAAKTADLFTVRYTEAGDEAAEPQTLEATWVDGGNGGYWTVPWPGNGTFEY